MRKFIVFAAALAAAGHCLAEGLHHFADIKSAVLTGKSIHIITDFAKCTPADKAAAQSMHAGVFVPSALQVTNDHIATSLTHFTLGSPRYPGKPVVEFVKYTLTDTDNLTLTAQTLDAVNYAPLGDKISVSCKLDAGVKVYI